jgi:phospholipid transport system substrate-binding protein
MYRLLAAVTKLKRNLLGACLALALALVISPVAGHAAPNPGDTVRHFYDTLLATMKKGPSLGEKGRYDELAPVIRNSFDLPYMTRMAVGPAWAKLSDAQKQQVTDAFARYITATYADRFDNYSGEKLQVTGEQNSAYGTIVQSRIVKSDGSPVSINYLMRQNGGAWEIADVYLSGSISQLATLRSEFSSVLARQGADGLIALLNRKAETLVASTARS